MGRGRRRRKGKFNLILGQPCPNPSGTRPSADAEPIPSSTEAEEARSCSEREREATPTPSVQVECGASSSSTGDLTTESQDYGSKAADSQPSWRPPIAVEEGIWKPIRVETNGEGKKRLFDADMLVEVYNVKVDLRGKMRGNIHGKVMLDCMIYKIDLFNRVKESAQMILKKGSLPLDGPDLAPLGYDPGAIIVDLKIDDEELCKGVVTWGPSHIPTNKWLYGEVQGKNGSVLVTYAVLLDACLAEVDVKLIQSVEQTAPFRIHGDIVVYISDMPYLRYYAFSKRSDNCTTIEHLDPIPLSRSLFSCRLGSDLVVKVDLWNADTTEPLACGALLFPLEYYGEFVGTLGDQNKIQVNVNWLSHTEHPKTSKVISSIIGF